MDRKKVILLVAALLIAAVTALMARSMFNGASAPESTAAAAPAPVPAGPKVLVATKALPVGTIITADSVRYQPWPKELIEAAYFKEGDGGASIESLVGTVVRNTVTAGQPLTQRCSSLFWDQPPARLATRFRNRQRGGIAPSPSAHTDGLFDRAENAVASIVADFDADDISILQEWRGHFARCDFFDHAHFGNTAVAASAFGDGTAGASIGIAVGHGA